MKYETARLLSRMLKEGEIKLYIRLEEIGDYYLRIHKIRPGTRKGTMILEFSKYDTKHYEIEIDQRRKVDLFLA